MSEERLKQVAEAIAAKRIALSVEEARELAKRAIRFKQEKGRLPSLTAVDPWEKRMAEGVAFLVRKVKEAEDMTRRTKVTTYPFAQAKKVVRSALRNALLQALRN